jgi:chaperonin GroEL (HSP60 family)
VTETDTVRIRRCSEKRSLLEKCAQTALNSKLIAHQKEFFGEMAVDAVMSLEDDLNLKMIGVKKVPGGSLTDSVLVKGVAFKKTFSYAGFEQQPKKFSDPLICLLNVELELKSEKDNAEVRIKDVAVRVHHNSPLVLASFSVCPIQSSDIVLCLVSHTPGLPSLCRCGVEDHL